jgi:hypothetical protein
MDPLQIYNKEWTTSPGSTFWTEVAPCDHVVQIYENDEIFLDLLTGYVSGGISAGDCVVVIATSAHLKAINTRLDNIGYSVAHLKHKNQYIAFDGDEALSRFMTNNWPDEKLFLEFVGDVINKAKSDKRNVRTFSEMVAILWTSGYTRATVELEHLWNKFCERENLCLFCAYPRQAFNQNASESVMHICGAHSKMITSYGKSTTDILYKNLSPEKV